MIGGYEVDAFGPGGVVEEPGFGEPVWARIAQIFFSTLFEILSGDLIGVGDNSVNHFDAIAIGFVLEVAADRVEGWSGEECQQRDDEDQQG